LRLILDVYEYSGTGKFLSGEQYSDSNNNIEGMTSPALTIVGESTPSTLLKALRRDDNAQNGFLPRFLLFKCEGDKPFANRDVKRFVSDKTRARIEQLVKTCGTAQNDVYDCYEMKWKTEELRREWRDYQDKWVTITNQERRKGEDTLSEAMSNRVAAIAAKLAGLHAVINNDDLFITAEDWDWGCRMAEWCYQGVREFMSDLDGNIETTSMNDLSLTVLRGIQQLIDKGDVSKDDRHVNNPQNHLLPFERSHLIIPGGHLRRKFRTKKAFEVMTGDVSKTSNMKDGLMKVLEMMVKTNLLREVEYRREISARGRKGDVDKVYQVTEEGVDMMRKHV